MSFPWPPERRCLCSHTFLIYFGRFWEGHLGKKPENALQNQFLMKSWSFYPLFIKKWFRRAFSGFLQKGPPKTPKKPLPRAAFAPRDHGNEILSKNGGKSLNLANLMNFTLKTTIFSLFGPFAILAILWFRVFLGPQKCPKINRGKSELRKRWNFNGISGLLWPFVFKHNLRKGVISGYRNHGKPLRISLKPDKSKSSFEVKDILPHLRIWENRFSGSWCTYLIRSWAGNMKSLWKRSAKMKKRGKRYVFRDLSCFRINFWQNTCMNFLKVFFSIFFFEAQDQ